MKKRAQASFDWGMVSTVAIAITLILIAIGGNYMYKKINLISAPEECILATGSGLICEDHSASASADTVTVRIGNILPDAIQVTSVDIVYSNDACTAYTTSTTINPDSTADIPVSCTLAADDKVTGTVKVTFNTVGGLSKTIAGTISTTAQ